jgi:catechol 2,3-dioxygenase-like lactoylglutathione lyase family enzyme
MNNSQSMPNLAGCHFGAAASIFCSVPLCLCVIFASAAHSSESVITRLAGVSFTVPDLDKARQFYSDVLGYSEAFDVKDAAGKSQSIFFKVNDDQYLEFAPGDVDGFRLDRVSLLTDDLKAVATALNRQGITTAEEAKGPDGTEFFSIRDPDRTEFRFVNYGPGSKQAESRGKNLSDKRVSTHFHHVGLAANNEVASMSIFKDALGMKEFSRGPNPPTDLRWINLSVPGSSGDLLEFMVLATQPPAARIHIGFEVPNIQETYKQITERGLKQQNRPFAAAIGRWIWFIRDPNNIRIEFMGQPTESAATK